MGRPLRIQFPGALYHITSRGNERSIIFIDDSDRIKFLQILEEYHERYGILIHSYVLMDNHYHLIMETPRGNLLKVMHGINGGYTGFFNRKYGRAGHLFQGRYKGIIVDKENYLIRLSRYVHLNPVRARIVTKPEKYLWSSYGGYISKSRVVKWVEYAWVLSRFGRNKKEAMKRYKEFVDEGQKGGLENPFKNVYGQLVLGGEKLQEKVRMLLKGQHLSDEIVERKRFEGSFDAKDVVREVARKFGESEKAIKRKGSRDNRARKVAIYIVKRYSGLSNEEIGKIFGGIHYSAVSKVSERVQREMEVDKKLLRMIGRLNSQFKT
ncbi:MAG: transposase [Thermodesulfobacteriota bacterium]